MMNKVSSRWVAMLLLAAGIVMEGRAQSPAPGFSADQRALLDGVKAIGAPGAPGPLCVFGNTAFAVVGGKTGENTQLPLVAASRMGRGRVVAFGHNGYLEPNTAADSAKLILNAIRWTAGQSATPIHVGVHKHANLLKYLQQQGIAAEALDGQGWEQRLKNVQVLCCDSESLSIDRDVPLVDKFIREGGGFVTGSLGWGWLQLNSGKTLQANHAGNRLLAPAGIIWTDGTLERTTANGYVTESLSPYLNAGTALDAIAAGTPLSGAESAQATASITQAARSLPPGDKVLLPRLASLISANTTAAVPTKKKPLHAKDALPRLVLTLQILEAQRAAPEQVRANPASAVFPGSVPANAPRVKDRAVDVDTVVPAWHSTGLYAAPGEVIHVTVPAAVADKKLQIRIGAHTDQLWNKESWSRAPEISVHKRITQETTAIASAFGGLVYIEVPDNAGLGTISVKISGAVEAPLFVLGKTSVDEWKTKLRAAPGPWAELANDKVIITVHSDVIRNLENPDELMEFWNRVLDADADLSTIPHQRKRPERIVADEQISAGYMHSGYPIMTWLDVEKLVTDAAKLKTSGSWGHFHELGHNHQQGDWTFDGTVEVTCNLYTLYCMENVCGLKAPQARDTFQPAKMEAMIRKHLGTGAKFERWKADPFLALISYYQLQQAFGWDAYKKVFAEYRALPKDQRPKSDEEKHDQWLVRFSRAVGKNLGPFYQAWGIPTSEKARASVADLPTWMPENFPPKQP